MKPALATIVLTALLAAPALCASDAPPTFNRDVAPIFFEHCVSCHQPGQIAPMSLLTYEEARPWAKSIRKAVASRTMPPWHADSTKVAYANDRSLEKDEIDTIVRWVASGAPQGAAEQPPPAPSLADGWRLGEPDLVFEVKEGFLIPADGEEISYVDALAELERILDEHKAKNNYKPDPGVDKDLTTLAARLEVKPAAYAVARNITNENDVAASTLSFYGGVQEIKGMLDAHLKSAKSDDQAFIAAKKAAEAQQTMPPLNAYLAGTWR